MWIGTNSITIYVLRQILPWNDLAKRLAGGDLAHLLNARLAVGTSNVVSQIVVLALLLWLARFLYRRNIFLRL